MGSAGTVNISLVAQTASFVADMKHASSAVTSLESMVSRAQSLVVGFLGVAALRSVVSWTEGIMQSIDATAKFADRIGASTEFLTTMAHAADLSGVANETLNAGLQKMVKNVSEATHGNKALAASFTEIGLSAIDLAGMDPEGQFLAIAEALKGVSNSGDKARITMDVFGKAGAELLPVLDMSKEGFAAMRKEADELGLSFSRMDAAKVEAANDALTRVGAAVRGIGIALSVELSPYVTALADDFLASGKSAGGFAKLAITGISAVRDSLQPLVDGFHLVMMGIKALEFAGNAIGWAIVKAAQDIVVAWQTVSGFFSNLQELWTAGFTALSVSFGVIWAAMKVPVAYFVQFVGEKISAMLYMAADAAGQFDAELGASLIAAAGSVSSTTGSMAVEARANLDKMTAAAAAAADNVGKALDGLFTIDAPGSEMLDDLIAAYEAAGETNANAYMEHYNAVFDADEGDSMAAWLARIDAQANANAEEIARAAAEKAKASREAGILSAEEYEESHMEIVKEGAKNKADTKKWYESQELANFQKYTGMASTLMNSHSRRMFNIGKAAAMANAIVSTAAGAAQALELGFPMGLIAMAAVIAAGAVQIGTIASTQFGGGGSVSSSSGSISLVGGEPIGVGQSAQPGVTGNRQNTLQVNFTGLSDNQILNGQQVRQLIEQINDAQSDGSPINVAVAA